MNLTAYPNQIEEVQGSRTMKYFLVDYLIWADSIVGVGSGTLAIASLTKENIEGIRGQFVKECQKQNPCVKSVSFTAFIELEEVPQP